MYLLIINTNKSQSRWNWCTLLPFSSSMRDSHSPALLTGVPSMAAVEFHPGNYLHTPLQFSYPILLIATHAKLVKLERSCSTKAFICFQFMLSFTAHFTTKSQLWVNMLTLVSVIGEPKVQWWRLAAENSGCCCLPHLLRKIVEHIALETSRAKCRPTRAVRDYRLL